MIIQIRGTSGSGKSTVMREVVNEICPREVLWEKHYVPKRRNPEYYSYKDVRVCGHYETPCGGCDTIGSARQVYELYSKLQNGSDSLIVLSEGLLLSEDSKWSGRLQDLRVVYLTTPVEVCIQRIKQRRKEAGNLKPLKENNTRRRVSVIERSRLKLRDAGIPCYRASCSSAVKLILSWVNKHAV